MLTALLLCIIVFGLLLFEKVWIKRNINKIPLRIHVNGTRGKSTTVKYISAILRSNNFKTASKITGITPTFFDFENSPTEIKRYGSARVTEQFRIINKAASLNSDALVLECMSINPELQKVESKAFSPKYYVITNILKDHLEEMGETEEEWVNSICSAIPANTTVLTSEKKHLAKIIEFAEANNSTVYSTLDIKINFELPENINEENVKLAYLFAEQEGLKTENFFRELELSEVENIVKVSNSDLDLEFYNGFAINDVPSAKKFLSKTKEKFEKERELVFIFNSRADRPYRSQQFAEWMAEVKRNSKIIVTGNHARKTKQELIRRGVEIENILLWKFAEVEKFVSEIRRRINKPSVVIGFGNIKNQGFQIIEAMKQLSSL